MDNTIQELQKLAGEMSTAGLAEAARMVHQRIGELQDQEKQAIDRWRNQRD